MLLRNRADWPLLGLGAALIAIVFVAWPQMAAMNVGTEPAQAKRKIGKNV